MNIIKHFIEVSRLFLGMNRIKKGKTSIIDFGKNIKLNRCAIIVHGENNKVVIGDNCNMRGLHILIEGNNNSIIFGADVIVNASKLKPVVINACDGTKVIVGQGTLFSNNIEVHTSDYHGIYNKDGGRINFERDIIIGKNVWVGLGCKILKGTNIANGIIVGMGSLVTGSFIEPNVIIAGNPAKLIKKQVFWRYDRADCTAVLK